MEITSKRKENLNFIFQVIFSSNNKKKAAFAFWNGYEIKNCVSFPFLEFCSMSIERNVTIQANIITLKVN